MERGDGLVVSIVRSLSEEFGIDLDRPWRDLSREQQKLILYGAGDRRVEVKWEGRHGSGQWAMRFEGILNTLMRRYKQTVSEQMREYYEKFCAKATATPVVGVVCGPSRVRCTFYRATTVRPNTACRCRRHDRRRSGAAV